MKNILRLSFLLFLAFAISIGDADAQNYGRKKKKKKKPKTEKTDDYFDESGGFVHRLWYGGMINFQIGGDGFGNSNLLLGLSPMVGYKINDNFSFGPRLTMNYFRTYYRGPDFKVMQWGIGGFGRAKFTPSLFAHVEYEVLTLNEISDFGLDDGNSDENFYLGVGYNSAMGGGFGYEILGLYNFIEEDETNVPIELRIGFTYNF
jgi:hypothetical protein